MLNELFFIALYLLSFSADSTASIEGLNSTWSAAAVEIARYVYPQQDAFEC
jgi:hypothetical protein